MSTHLARLQTKIGMLKQMIDIIKAWDESKHPRDEYGRFVSVASEEAAFQALQHNLSDPEYISRYSKVGAAIAESLGFPSRFLVFEHPDKIEEGVAGHFNPLTGKITINLAVNPTRMRGVLSHEVTHAKWNVYTSQFELGQNVLDKLRKSDGVTAYSREHWQEFERVEALREREQKILDRVRNSSGKSSEIGDLLSQMKNLNLEVEARFRLPLAIEETLAEMARIKSKSGKLRGNKLWKGLYKHVDRVYNQHLGA